MCGGVHAPAVAFWVDETLAILLEADESPRNQPLKGFDQPQFRGDGTMILGKVR